MGPWPDLCAQAGAGCPGWGPDVRRLTKSRMSGLELPDSFDLWLEGAGFPGVRPDVRDFARRRMSGVDAGCPRSGALGGWAAVAVVVVSSGRMSGPGAGCPGPGVVSVFFRRHFRARLALVLGFSMVSSGVPKYAQGPRLK